jgi:hypothetical protein
MSNVTNPNRWTLRAALAALAFSTAMGLSAAHADSITVYTSYEEDEPRRIFRTSTSMCCAFRPAICTPAFWRKPPTRSTT